MLSCEADETSSTITRKLDRAAVAQLSSRSSELVPEENPGSAALVSFHESKIAFNGIVKELPVARV